MIHQPRRQRRSFYVVPVLIVALLLSGIVCGVAGTVASFSYLIPH